MKLRIIAAPDKFKGSMTADAAARAVIRGAEKAAGCRGIELSCEAVHIADGGEGTLEALVPPEKIKMFTVTGPDGSDVEAPIGIDGSRAVIEMARASGLLLMKSTAGQRVKRTTTYGTGMLIKAAIDAGASEILLTAGGSATNDGGCGMLAALGTVFRDRRGRRFVPAGGNLGRIASIDMSGTDSRLYRVKFTVATDVKNPLTGPDGATYVYSPQKGAGPSLLPVMEAGMKNYAEIIKRMTGTDVSGMPGCGAGGGLPAPLAAFFGAKIMTGIDAVLEAADFDDLLRSADLVITGEGKLDSQSLFGKAVSGVAAAAARRGVPAVCIAGVSGLDEDGIRRIGLRKLYTLASEAPDPGYSMSHAEELTELLAARAVEEFLSDREVEG